MQRFSNEVIRKSVNSHVQITTYRIPHDEGVIVLPWRRGRPPQGMLPRGLLEEYCFISSADAAIIACPNSKESRQYFLPVLPNILPLRIVHEGNPEFPLSRKC
jgi:hypothetical protein